MNRLQQKFEEAKAKTIDMASFMDTLKDYAGHCEHITEFGVRGIISTWALLSGAPKRMVSYDVVSPSEHGARIEDVYEVANENAISYEFRIQSSLDAEIESTELLFIDTLHTYDQLSAELSRHADKASKYIICHDSSACPEVKMAIEDFLAKPDCNWSVEKEMTEWPGLLIMRNKSFNN